MYQQSRDHDARLIRCENCQYEFDRATAVDEMFADGTPMGYAEWTGGVLVAGTGYCYPSQTVLLDVRRRITRIYDIEIGRQGSWLAGGLSATFLPQGYVMVAVAPYPEPTSSEPVNLLIQATGAAPDATPLSPFREILLEARRIAVTAPKLTTILCVAALDLFFEEISSGTVKRNRPRCWERLFKRATGRSLGDALGDRDLGSLHRLLAVRDIHAHGRDYMQALPSEIREPERNYLGLAHRLEKPLAPSARWALSVTLGTIRQASKKC
ncbi:MAG: hypothetical protein ACRETQ_07450 [Gammaproteobacteria bacterium]